MNLIRSILGDKKDKLTLYLFMSVLIALLDVGLAIIMGICVDVAMGERQGKLVIYAAVFAAYIVVFYGTYLLYRRIMYKIEQLIRTSIKSGIFHNMYTKELIKKNERNSGEWISVLTTDVNTSIQSYFEVILKMIPDVVSLVISTGIMLYVSPILFAFVFLITIFQMIIPNIMSKPIMNGQKAFSEASEQFDKKLSDHLQGYKTMFAYGKQRRSEQILKAETETLDTKQFLLSGLRFKAQMMAVTMGNISYIGLFFVGAILILKGHLTVGALIVASQLAVYITGPMQTITESVADIKGTKEIVEKLCKLALIGDFSEKEPQDTSLMKNTVLEEIENKRISAIELKDVSYAYEEGTTIIEQANINLIKEKSYLISAPSGTGKSTLAGIISGFINPLEGAVLYKIDCGDAQQEMGNSEELSECNISKWNAETISSVCIACPQDTFVFQDSLKNNISLFDETVSNQEIENVIHDIGLDDMLKKHDDNKSDRCADMEVLQGGTNLSGGELQRIALARVLIKKPSFVILDESFANLDMDSSELLLRKMLDNKDTCILYITHEDNTRITNLFSHRITIKSRHIQMD